MTYRVTASALNLRAGPGTGYPVLDVIGHGEHVESERGDWLLVQAGDRVGWVSRRYLQRVEDAPQTPDAFFRLLDEYLTSEGIRHFTAREVCPVGKRNGSAVLQPAPRSLWTNIIPTLRVADWLRDQIGPLPVTSGYRDPAYNHAIGSSPTSLHVSFNAIDISSRSHPPPQIAALLERHPESRSFGIGVYSSFAHLDTRGKLGRPAPARW